MIQVIHVRPRDFLLVDTIFISSRPPSYSDCQLRGVFAANIGVGVMTRQYQNLTADGRGVTVVSFHPQLTGVTVM